jgi:hypothetical protein
VTDTEMAALAAAAMAAVTINPEKRLSMTISFCLGTVLRVTGAKPGTYQAIRSAQTAGLRQATDLADAPINIAGLPKNEIWHVPLGSSLAMLSVSHLVQLSALRLGEEFLVRIFRRAL